MRSIDTLYNGYRFRSRLEARWAVFFDAAHLRWEYEKEGFDLGGIGRYLPDFWLPDLKCFIEVKGDEPTADELKKAERLMEESGWPVVVVFGEIASGPWTCYSRDLGHDSAGQSEWQVFFFVCECGQVKVSWGNGCHQVVGVDWKPIPHWCGWDADYTIDACGPEFPAWSAPGSVWKFVSAARSARFEFGQTPKGV